MSETSVVIPLTPRAALLLLQKSQAKNCTPSQLIEDEFSVAEAEEVNSKSDIYSKPLEEALERAKRISQGDEFTLARLYPNDWELVPSPTAFGRLFKEALEQQGIARHAGRDNTVKMAKYLRT
jgi:hypothetical protein